MAGDAVPVEPAAPGVVISAAVMTHPRRQAEAARLAEALGGWHTRLALDPRPDGPPTTLRTAWAAWAAIRPGATHHLVLQDDVELCRDFTERVESAAREHPDTPLAFYANWDSWNGAATRAAALGGARWVPAVPGEWVPTLALLLPRRDVEALLSATHPDHAEPEPDDVALARVLRARGRRVLISVPHLVEHTGQPSLVGNDRYGPRHSACFADDVHDRAGAPPGAPPGERERDRDRDRPADSGPARLPEVLVHRLRGRAHIVLTGPDPLEDEPRFISLRAYLDETGMTGRGLAHWEKARRDLQAPDSMLRLCEELWYCAYLLGAHTGSGHMVPPPRLVRVALRSLVLGGTALPAEQRLWTERHAARLTTLAEHGFAAGLDDHRTYGPPRPVPAERRAALPPAERIWQDPRLADAA
ncbi:hypothetical protein AB0A69_06480 [Streptomyces sp. NPDC045431]|uniref:hypothetical protein n=1 Tax=Streptomyces sp. NPDC045431 TaxID=3155613 RepID=UPI0033DD53F3